MRSAANSLPFDRLLDGAVAETFAADGDGIYSHRVRNWGLRQPDAPGIPLGSVRAG